ncbi:MAG: hypothetical protein HC906_06725 [Bacteroidales bacterium]|nr:hypothetical protein [Bacteroidales bacterium]
MERKKSSIFGVILLFCFTISGNAQNWINYTKATTMNKLCNDTINCVVVDDENRVWFGTENGISLFDGNDWYSFLPGKKITCGACDKNGILWFGTDSGSIIKYFNQTWEMFSSKDQLPGNIIYSIGVDDLNNKWFGADQCHLTLYDNAKWVQYEISDLFGYSTDAYDITSFAFDSSNRVWLGFTSCDWGLLVNYDNNYHLFDIPHDYISDVVIDEEQNIWVGTANGILKYHDDTFDRFDNLGGITWSHVKDIVIDNNNTKWIGTGAGLFSFDDVNWEGYTTNDGIVSNFINTIAIDHEGSLWLGTDKGISKYPSLITNLSENQENDEVFKIFPNPVKII